MWYSIPPLQGPEISFELHGTEAPGAPGVCEVSPLQIPSAAGRRQWLVLLMSENELVVGR